jgi:hypothetical protein
MRHLANRRKIKRAPEQSGAFSARADALCCVASTLRLSFRAITVFVFSRASDLSMRASSFVHGRLRVIFFAIVVPHTSVTNESAAIVNQKCPHSVPPYPQPPEPINNRTV